MNIKSLLLGSAAALAVVSGAQAADAIVAAEPEPMEYVRVCDAYGTGYFYIPGTETCLRIGGVVQFQANAASSYNPGSDNGWSTRSRFELNVDTASDTEYGPLKTQVILRQDFLGTYNDNVGGGVIWGPNGRDSHTETYLLAANIQIAGFLVGLADSQYSSFTNYAGDIINDDVISYGGFEVNQISYNYDGGNGFKAMISLQDDREGVMGLDAFGNVVYFNGADYGVDVVAGLGYSTGAFGFTVVGGYDESMEDGAIKARVDGTFGNVSAFLMGGWNTGDVANEFAPWNGDWAVWGGLGAKFSDTLAGNLQVAYSDNYSHDNVLAVAANLKWNPVQNLLIQPEITYTKWDNWAGTGNSEDQWNGVLRFQRKF